MNEKEQKARHTAIEQLRTDVQRSLEQFENDITTICTTAIDSFAEQGTVIRNNVQATCDRAQEHVNSEAIRLYNRMAEVEALLPKSLPGWAGRWEKAKWLFR